MEKSYTRWASWKTLTLPGFCSQREIMYIVPASVYSNSRSISSAGRLRRRLLGTRLRRRLSPDNPVRPYRAAVQGEAACRWRTGDGSRSPSSARGVRRPEGAIRRQGSWAGQPRGHACPPSRSAPAMPPWRSRSAGFVPRKWPALPPSWSTKAKQALCSDSKLAMAVGGALRELGVLAEVGVALFLEGVAALLCLVGRVVQKRRVALSLRVEGHDDSLGEGCLHPYHRKAW